MQKIDTSYRRSLHEVVDIIPQEVIEKGNRKKSWKYGYNGEYDVVIISKDGTIGEIISIEGLAIALPSAPKKIRFEDLPIKDQKWQRYKVPQDLMYFDKLYKDEENIEVKINEIHKKHEGFIKADFQRKFNGDWFMNNGVPIYITGNHYFFLQHYKLTDSNTYAHFRMPQRDYFIFVEACFADHRSLGVLLLKSRRSAFSTSSGSIVLNKSITFRNGFFPIVSKKDEDAQDFFKKHIVKTFLNLPKHLQPQRTGEAVPKKELVFSSPQRKLTTKNKSITSDFGLDTQIEYRSTTIDTYDGVKVVISINDEVGKFKGGLDINDYWEQAHKMCHLVGSEVVGKALCGSTANPPNKGGKNYEEFYKNSKLSTRDKTGMTNTGLYAIFIPADYSTMGFFDEYGYPIYDTPKQPIKNELGKMVEIGVKEFLDLKEASCGDNLKKLNARKRNNPRTDTDPFLDEDATNMYATTGMVNHNNFLKEFQTTPKYKSQVFRFDLYYKPLPNNPHNVEIKHTDKGRFVASWLPAKEFRNDHRIVDGKLYPKNGHLGALGADPYQADRPKYGGGSKMGLVGITTKNPTYLLEHERSKTFLFYNHRPNTVEEAEEDVIKLLLYLSMPILPETNKDGLVKTLHKRGLRKFVLEDPLKKKKELSEQGKKYGGIYTSTNNRGKQEQYLETYILENVPEVVDENKIKVPFPELNEMAMEYTDSTRTKLDGVVAWQLACLGVSVENNKKERTLGNNPIQQDIAIEESIIDLFKMKDN